MKKLKAFFNNGFLTIYKANISFVRESFKSVDSILYFVNLCLLTIFVFFSLLLGRKPFNYIANVVAVLLFFSTYLLAFIRKRIILNNFTLFWMFFLILSTIVNIVQKTNVTTHLANIVTLLTMYQMVIMSSKREKDFVIRVLYYAFFSLAICMCAKYGAEYLHTRDTSIFYDSFFGNIDGVSNYMGFGLVLSLFYLRKGDAISPFASLLFMLLIILLERRTAFLLAFIAVLIFLYSLIGKKHPIVLALVASALLLFTLLLLILIPSLEGIWTRLLNTISGLFGGDTDGSTAERVNMVIDGLFYSLIYLFRAVGNGGYVLYSGAFPHDAFGDLGYSYGGIVSLATNFAFIIGSISLIKHKNYYSNITLSCGLFVIIFLLVNTFLNGRIVCMCVGMIQALSTSERANNITFDSQLRFYQLKKVTRYYEIAI
ncbi:MAG: hypothetical protein WC366_04230 [Bacilli bacterium]|jgi:hypothetical protein